MKRNTGKIKILTTSWHCPVERPLLSTRASSSPPPHPWPQPHPSVLLLTTAGPLAPPSLPHTAPILPGNHPAQRPVIQWPAGALVKASHKHPCSRQGPLTTPARKVQGLPCPCSPCSFDCTYPLRSYHCSSHYFTPFSLLGCRFPEDGDPAAAVLTPAVTS